MRLSLNPNFVPDPSSRMDAIMSLFMQAVRSKVKTSLDLSTIIKSYAKTIKSSTDLTQIEKDALMAGLAIMKYSVAYWAVKSPYQLTEFSNES